MSQMKISNRFKGFLLYNLGYDIWMLNARGNDYSTGHLKYNRTGDDRRDYWNFSWHEIGIYDLPATIDYILKQTDYSRLHYIGHSQGTTTFFVLCSEKPEYNDKISLMVAMAPVVFIGHNNNDIVKSSCKFLKPIEVSFSNLLKKIYETIANKKILFHSRRFLILLDGMSLVSQ